MTLPMKSNESETQVIGVPNVCDIHGCKHPPTHFAGLVEPLEVCETHAREAIERGWVSAELISEMDR